MDKRIWTIVDRNRGIIIDFRVGNDNIENANMLMYNLLSNNNKIDLTKEGKENKNNKIINIDYLCTDGHHAYNVVANHPLFKDYIKHHIVSKKETCLVESFNSYLRDNLARLKRKTKAYSKSQYMLEISIRLVIYKDIICNNKNSINKYCKYYVNEGKMG